MRSPALLLAILCPLLPTPAVAAAAGPNLAVPEGRHVLADGALDDGEWDDAAPLRLGGVELLAKRDPRYLYLALRFVEGKHSGLDLYLAGQGGARRLFHVSGQLGTKRFADGSWSEYDWDVEGWVGNPVAYVLPEKEGDELVIYEPEGFELQLSREMLAAEGLGANHLRLAFRLKRPEVTVPVGAEEAEPGEWIVLDLSGADP